jgi:4-amino-4-deoxy-L-arabinose transferase-like glycosyltransferase
VTSRPHSIRPSGPSTREPRPGVRWACRAALAVLVIGFVALGLSEAWTDSPTFDEPVYVSAGVAAVLHHDVTLNDEHPPLFKVLAALPVLAAHPVVPVNGDWSGNDERVYSAAFVDAQLHAGTLRRVTFASRLVPLAEAVGVALVLAAMASGLFGPGAGLLAAALWLASPFVLGLGHLDGTDLPVALAVSLNSWALLAWLRRRRPLGLVLVGLAAALTADSQVTGLAIAALDLVVVAAASRRDGLRAMAGRGATVAVLTLVGVWLPYVAVDPAILAHRVSLLPSPYLNGIRYLADHDTVGAPGYLVGVAYSGGRWWYWPVGLVVKEPVAFLVMAAAGLASWWWLEPGRRRRAATVLVLPAVVLGALTVVQPRDIGVRYLLPVVALGCAAGGALLPAVRLRTGRTRRALLPSMAVVVALLVAATAVSFPDSLSYVSAPFRPAYAAATNADVDWGQGYYRLEAWSGSRHPFVAYFGPRGLPPTGPPGGRALLGTPPSRVTGWVAVSATLLTSQDARVLAWLRRYCPVGTLGGSILLYRFTRPPTAGPSPASPPAACPGPVSRLVGR